MQGFEHQNNVLDIPGDAGMNGRETGWTCGAPGVPDPDGISLAKNWDVGVTGDGGNVRGEMNGPFGGLDWCGKRRTDALPLFEGKESEEGTDA